jgi:two-component system chemotaxis response regulator CheY
MIDLDSELADDYLAESLDHLATMETELLALGAGGPELEAGGPRLGAGGPRLGAGGPGLKGSGAGLDTERFNRFFRAIHSIKGGAGVFQLVQIGELAHQMENVLASIGSGKLAPIPERLRILLQGTDGLRDLIQNPGTSDRADIAGLMAALKNTGEDRRPSAGAVPVRVRPAGETLRVLIVEDDFASRVLLQAFLGPYAECHIAVNGREAVEAVRSALERGQLYDLICMDIMMPEMDGREAVRQVRALERERGILSTHGAKIVMTTAVDDMKQVIRCFQELCDGYLMKPIELDQLLAQMKSHQLIR